MRSRLTAAILLLLAGTLVLTGVGGILLVRRAELSSAEQQLHTQAAEVAEDPGLVVGPGNSLDVIRRAGGYDSLSVAALSPDGTFDQGLPRTLVGPVSTAALQRGHTVTGHRGDLAFVMIPIALTATERLFASPPVAFEDQPVLVATRTVSPTFTGAVYFVVVALVCLAVATAVAYWLASRFSRPVTAAVAATRRMAGGDLTARMPTAPDDLAEFADLAAAINTMADRLERARHQQRQFLLSVSHDLRTPLTSIRGYAEALAEGATDDVAGAVAVIAAEADRLDRLVRDLLDLARLDARRFSFEPTVVDLNDVVRAACDREATTAAERGLRLDAARPDAGGVRVLADADRLLQLLGNLVENALRFATAGVTLGARLDGATAVLWVLDDGPGIPADDLPRIFEPHFTADRAGATRRGTGLGLAIVAELTAAMGGTVRAESPVTARGGTRFCVTFPALSAGVPAAAG